MDEQWVWKLTWHENADDGDDGAFIFWKTEMVSPPHTSIF